MYTAKRENKERGIREHINTLVSENRERQREEARKLRAIRALLFRRRCARARLHVI